MTIYNTLSRSVEEFDRPKNEPISVYTCGPTVYDFMHIGNLRTFLFSDLFERVLRFNGYKTKTVQNITDIDDKIIKRAKERNISISELSQEYEKFFLSDIKKLNIKPKDVTPHATEYVKKMQDYIQVLIDKEFAYIEKDGSVYFDISKFADYGKLSGIDSSSLKPGTRILSDEYTKDDVQDFALWKSESKEEVGYDSPWGWGRPGWHIECSVMSQENLGETLDVHMGGVDLIFPHHENEIAQSEAKTGKKFVRYWVHGAHILVDGKKMSKSLGNFYRLKDLTDKDIDPLALRYLYLQTHYRQEMNFTWEALEAAQTALSKLRQHSIEFESRSFDYKSDRDPSAEVFSCFNQFSEAVNDDLNFPMALGALHQGLNKAKDGHDVLYLLQRTDEVLGLGLTTYKKEEVEIPTEIQELANKREELRKSGKYEEADKVRAEIEEKGFMLEDSPKGVKIRKN